MQILLLQNKKNGLWTRINIVYKFQIFKLLQTYKRKKNWYQKKKKKNEKNLRAGN